MKLNIKQTIRLLVLGFIAIATIGCSNNDPYLGIEPEGNTNNETLRLVSYNILEGMKEDKKNDYENFIEWIKSYDIDILALQEANGFTQKSLEKLAARYGHPYVVTNVKVGDNYPVALTSKYPIESRRRLTKHMSHGAIFASIKGVNIVNTHLWPQNYWHATGDGKGTEYRLQEIGIVLDSTVHKYPDEEKWLLMGDFNSNARIDRDGLPNPDGRDYRVHDMIAGVNYFDAVRHFKNIFHHTTPTVFTGWYPGATNVSRIDFIYGTPAMLKDMTHSQIIYDDFTHNYSDHYPTMIEFRY